MRCIQAATHEMRPKPQNVWSFNLEAASECQEGSCLDVKLPMISDAFVFTSRKVVKKTNRKEVEAMGGCVDVFCGIATQLWEVDVYKYLYLHPPKYSFRDF